jgi:hypothetical protein
MEAYLKALNKLAKWRTVFAGWQLGTRAKGDPECDAVRDHREVTILMRAELNAFTGILLRKGVFSEAEWAAALSEEAVLLDKDYEAKFPGITTSEAGTHYTAQAAETMKGWRP